MLVMGLEIEAKIALDEDVNAMRERLKAAGAVMEIERVYENNIRYESAANDLTENGIVLRLRQDQQVRLTYKAPSQQESKGASTRLELETTVGDFEAMDEILRRLGYRAYMRYEKYRTTYTMSDIEDTEIVLDEMPYGLFIEVEGPAESIDRALEKLGLAEAPRIVESYAVLFDKVRARYGLDFKDLTFENFAGVDVAPDVFAVDKG
jgi:adenylate cyclase class 2